MEMTGFWFLVPFAVLALLFLIDVVSQMVTAIRRHFAPEDALASTSYSAGFNLRRPDSALRERYHPVQPRGRTTEICKAKIDPYDP